MKISVIIVNYNVKYFLEQCLSSVMAACRNIEAEILVVDNNSADGSREYFKGRFDKVLFTWSEVNLGFGRANNLALKEAKGDYILFLNPDTILPEDCLKKCLAFLSNQKEPGALGIRMIDGSGSFLKESKRGFPSPFTSFCKLSGLTALFPASPLFARYYLGHLDPLKNQEVDVLSGAFMMINKKILDLTGGFDERFFMYGEDIDLSYRIQKAGFKNYYFSECTILHFKGESTKKGSLNYIRLFYGAMSLFVAKHYSTGIAQLYKLLIQPAIWLQALVAGMANYINRLFRHRKKANSGEVCFIVAEKEDFDFITSILEKSNMHRPIMHRISPGDFPREDAAGKLAQLSILVEKQPETEIIFSLSGLPVNDAVSLMQKLPKGIHYWFHFTGTNSIVGSKQ